MQDYYDILGIKYNASTVEIKKAFYRLAREFHPDVSGTTEGNEDFFKQITESYQTLSDPDLRRHYDIKRIVRNSTASPKKQVKQAMVIAMQNISDFLSDYVFKTDNNLSDQKSVSGENIEVELEINFSESFLGVNKSVYYQAPRVCIHCQGKGWPPKNPPRTCSECLGSKIKFSKRPIPFKRSCKKCNGKGIIQTHTCVKCHGRLLLLQTENIWIEVPPSVLDGTKIIKTKEGGSGVNHGQRGDLIIQIRVLPDIKFVRKMDDLHTTHSIKISELLLGTKILINIPGQNIELQIPPKTDLSRKFRVKNQGFKSIKKDKRGDLYVALEIKLPEQIPEAAEPLIRQLSNTIPGF